VERVEDEPIHGAPLERLERRYKARDATPAVAGGVECLRRAPDRLLAPDPVELTLEAIRETGLEVPRDISLIGYDDPDWFKVWGPGITTIALPIREMAVVAASLVGGSPLDPALHPEVSSIEGTLFKKLSFPLSLILRGSDRSC
jgi:hypothetical protein